MPQRPFKSVSGAGYTPAQDNLIHIVSHEQQIDGARQITGGAVGHFCGFRIAGGRQ